MTIDADSTRGHCVNWQLTGHTAVEAQLGIRRLHELRLHLQQFVEACIDCIATRGRLRQRKVVAEMPRLRPQ